MSQEPSEQEKFLQEQAELRALYAQAVAQEQDRTQQLQDMQAARRMEEE